MQVVRPVTQRGFDGRAFIRHDAMVGDSAANGAAVTSSQIASPDVSSRWPAAPSVLTVKMPTVIIL